MPLAGGERGTEDEARAGVGMWPEQPREHAGKKTSLKKLNQGREVTAGIGGLLSGEDFTQVVVWSMKSPYPSWHKHEMKWDLIVNSFQQHQLENYPSLISAKI